MLNMKKYSRPAVKAEDSPDIHEGVDHKFLGSKTIKLFGEKMKTDLKDKVQFKRKKAKVLQRFLLTLIIKRVFPDDKLGLEFLKATLQNFSSSAPQESKDAEQTVRSRSRKRKRSHKSKNVEPTN